MRVNEVSYEEYTKLNFKSHFYNSSKFINYNKNKCEEVKYLVFKDTKVRFGLVLGVQNGMLKSPFSAPFGGFSYYRNDIKHSIFNDAIKGLKEYCFSNNFKGIRLTMPPVIYDNSNNAKMITALLMEDFTIDFVDINHSYDLRKFSTEYINQIQRNARKSLNISFAKKLNFQSAHTVEEKEIAYEVIKQNRSERGFPLKLSFRDIMDTIEFTKSFFFIVSTESGVPIASAICFEINSEIVQVIYWGNLVDYSAYKPMNFLSFKLFEYFFNAGYKTLDIGPSSSEGVVNFGLSEFKESIGCERHLKFSFTYRSHLQIQSSQSS